MSILKKSVGVAVVALAAMGIAAGPASADTIKANSVALDQAVFDSLDQAWESGDRIKGTSPQALLETAFGDIDCDSAFLSTVAENPGDTGSGVSSTDDVEVDVDPGKNRGQSGGNTVPRDYLEFTGCTDTIPGIIVFSAEIQGSIVGVADADASPKTLTLTDIWVDVDTSIGTCSYGGDVEGDLDEMTQTLVFDQEPVTKSAGGFLCPNSGAFSATYDLSAYDWADTALSSPLGTLTLEN